VSLGVQFTHGTYSMFDANDMLLNRNSSEDEVASWTGDNSFKARLDETVQLIVLYKDSYHSWDITPPSRNIIKASLMVITPTITMDFYFTRTDPVTQTSGQDQSSHLRWTAKIPDSQRDGLLGVLNGTLPYIDIVGLYPLVMRVPTSQVPSAVGTDVVTGRLSRTNTSDGHEWWSLQSLYLPYNPTVVPGAEAVGNSTGITFFVISDTAFLSLFSSALYSYSILTLYFTFVFSLGRFLRLYVLGMSMRIIYEDIPNVSFVLELCNDIYSARSDGMYALEEDLYGELIQLYRSPETLYEKTLPTGSMVGVSSWPARLTTNKQKKD